ncbi:hypothetical protein C900_01453 [Fulvivirga imtechensis AK7]|uniref:Uncharacterized protein n=1 Tax=Fulvivirga imtechensis AK7 TaxID=1237149 RepID=L8JU18_9BACT|nr:hypothetical protein C900_01453 [Fulvivirga imtechensis AK7]
MASTAVIARVASIDPDTVTVGVEVNSTGAHTPLLANMLNVVVVDKDPVGKLIVPPLPATADPTLLSSASLRN